MKVLSLILILALLLTGCAAVPSQEQPTAPAESGSTPADTEKAPDPTALAEPEGLTPGLYVIAVYEPSPGEIVSSMAVSGSEAVLLLTDFGPGGEFAEDGPGECAQYFQFADLEQGCLTERVEIEVTENGDLYQVRYADDGRLLLENPWMETAALYDHAGTLLETVPHEPDSYDWPPFAHSLMTSWFSAQNDCACFHCNVGSEILYSAYTFAEEPDALYLVDGGFDTFFGSDGRRLLEMNYEENGDLLYRVLDLEAGAVLDTLTIPKDAPPALADYTYLNTEAALLCEGGVLLRVGWSQFDPERFENGEYGEGEELSPKQEERLYFWKLADNASPIEVRRVTASDLEAENEAMVQRIAADYQIQVLLDTAPEDDTPPLMEYDDPEEYKDAHLILGVELFAAYDLLRQLEVFLQSLPVGFTRDMQTDFPEPWDEYGMTGFDGFDIYVVKEIPGGSAAYANGWGERLLICLATDEFSYSTLPHEFMHLIERRIHAWYESQNESFWGVWDTLNPEDFYYAVGQDDTDLPYDWFVSRYAMTDSMEDRAETFQYLFTSTEPLKEAWWYADSPHVQAKVALLCEAIRNAYPSVQAVERACWEKE